MQAGRDSAGSRECGCLLRFVRAACYRRYDASSAQQLPCALRLALVREGNYCAANAFMDSFAAYRRDNGLPTVSVQWGPWAEIGAPRPRALASAASRTARRMSMQPGQWDDAMLHGLVPLPRLHLLGVPTENADRRGSDRGLLQRRILRRR